MDFAFLPKYSYFWLDWCEVSRLFYRKCFYNFQILGRYVFQIFFPIGYQFPLYFAAAFLILFALFVGWRNKKGISLTINNVKIDVENSIFLRACDFYPFSYFYPFYIFIPFHTPRNYATNSMKRYKNIKIYKKS